MSVWLMFCLFELDRTDVVNWQRRNENGMSSVSQFARRFHRPARSFSKVNLRRSSSITRNFLVIYSSSVGRNRDDFRLYRDSKKERVNEKMRENSCFSAKDKKKMFHIEKRGKRDRERDIKRKRRRNVVLTSHIISLLSKINTQTERVSGRRVLIKTKSSLFDKKHRYSRKGTCFEMSLFV